MANGVNDLTGGLSAAAQPMAQPVNQYFNDTPLERNIREDTLRGVRWAGGEGVLEKDVGRQEGGLGQFQPRPVVDLRYDPTFSGSEFSPTLGQSLSNLRSADLYGVTGSQSSETGGLFATPGASYRLMVGGKEVGAASTPQEMERLAALASEVGANKKADVRIQGKFGPTQDWTDTFVNAPDVSGAGIFADFVLPAIGGVLLPGVGGVLGGALGAGLGAAAGSGLSSALQGRSFGDALTRAALSGVTAGGLSAATGTPLMSAAGAKASGFGSGLVPSDIAGTGSLGFTLNVPVAPTPNFTAGGLGLGGISGIGADALDDIVVTGVRNAATSSFLPTLPPFTFDPSVIPQVNVPRVEPPPADAESAEPESVVTGERIRVTPPGATLPINPFDLSVIPRVDVPRVESPVAEAESDEPESVVTGERIRITPPGATLPINPFNPSVIPQVNVPRVGPLPANAESADPEQVVTGKKIPPNPPTTISFPNAPFYVPPTTIPPFEAPPTVKKPDGTIAKVTGGLTILDALSKLLGGTRGGTGGTGTGLDSLAPVFRAQLPAPRGQFAPSALTQRDRSDIDYARYGYGPARSFFNYVPETAAERAAFAAAAAPAPRVGVGSVFSTGAAPVGATTSVLSSSLDMLRAAMPGASDAEIEAFLGTPEGRQALTMIFEDMGAQPRAKGGKMGGDGRGRESFAVDGVGTGRSDEIPALLSDGEYVIDAETVAMLGDGSSKAGAKRLDDFRVKVRKHKGRNLAKGKFSANAKRPERYLSGGLV
jgi:hypothetical protein